MIVSEKKKKNQSFLYNDLLGVKLITLLRLGLSHLNKHKFRQINFLNESPLQMMKDIFSFMSEALFVLKILEIL